MGTGAYGGPVGFRAGSQRNNIVEVLHKDLNQARGTAYDIEQGSFVWYENYALAKALSDAYEEIRRFANQSNSDSITVFLSRWESILNITPNPGDSIQTRQNRISEIFSLWNNPPNFDNVATQISDIIGVIFRKLEYYDPLLNLGAVPGGVSVPGGVTLPDGPWRSRNNTVQVRIWQPRDNNGNLLMDTPTFLNNKRTFVNFLTNYLPAYNNFTIIQFVTDGYGTISGTQASTAITGSGTQFSVQFSVGQEIETVDDNNNWQSYVIETITDNTHMTIATTLNGNITNRKYRLPPSYGGFILDVVQNLDNSTFR